MSQADIDTVYKLHTDFVAAMKRADTDHLVNSFTADGMIMAPGEPKVQGREAIRAWFDNFNENFVTVDSVATDQVYIDGGDCIVESGEFAWKVRPKAGGESTETKSKWLAVWQRQPDGAWKLARDMFNTNA